jgi:hypothetical protein
VPRFVPRGHRTPTQIPTTTGAPGDTFPAVLTLQRNPMRRELLIHDRGEAIFSGEEIAAYEATFLLGGKGLDTFGMGPLVPPLVLPGYTGELYAVAVAAADVYLAELVDDVDQATSQIVPMRLRTTFLSFVPTQGPGIAPVKILEADPDGLRRFVLLTLSAGGLLLSTTPTPGDTFQLFQYGQSGGTNMDPFLFPWPFVPRSALFGMRMAGGAFRAWVTEGLGGTNIVAPAAGPSP